MCRYRSVACSGFRLTGRITEESADILDPIAVTSEDLWRHLKTKIHIRRLLKSEGMSAVRSKDPIKISGFRESFRDLNFVKATNAHLEHPKGKYHTCSDSLWDLDPLGVTLGQGQVDTLVRIFNSVSVLVPTSMSASDPKFRNKSDSDGQVRWTLILYLLKKLKITICLWQH